jgi:hypothetical protein
MGTTTKRVKVGRDHRVHIEIDVSTDLPEGEAEATVVIKPVRGNGKRGIAALAGVFRGRVRTADDFDAPLEDFAEYQ